MSAEKALHRFDELNAGRVLGDLNSKEISEWKILAEEHEHSNAIDLELLATELELKHTQPCDLSSSLSNKLISTIPSFVKSAKYPKQSSTQIVSILPWLGWAVAACLIVMFNLPMQKEVTETPLSVSQKLETLIASYPNTQRLAFDPASPSYSEVSGEVIWNDERQEGYMSLASLPVNNPTQNQYQLWIVDPERDELPVDGGVFDIPSGTGPSIIPIRNALPIKKPVAFVITLEQPGGVVKSKQEVVVALAKS
jgi:hypothetical protein